MLADMLHREFNEEEVVEVLQELGFSERFKGVSPCSALLNEGTETPEGLPLVAGSLITSTRSPGAGGESSWSFFIK